MALFFAAFSLASSPASSATPEQATATSPKEILESGVKVRLTGVDDKQWELLQPMLRDQLTLSGLKQATEPLADDLAFFTRQHFIREGWPDAEVQWEMSSGEIHLGVKAGPQTRVGAVQWKGDTEVLPEEEMRKFLLRPSIEKEGVDKENPIWVGNDLQTGAGLVQRRLRAEGYLQAETQLLPSPNLDPEGRRDLTLAIEAGPRFQFGRLTLTGAPLELDQEARQIVESVQQGSFNEARVQQIESQLTQLAKEHGWLQAEASSKYVLHSSGGTVDVALLLTPGERFRVASVVPHEGFSRGSQRVIRAGFRELQGRYYSSKDLDLVFRRALDTSMFARLDVDPVPTPEEPPLPITKKTNAALAHAPAASLHVSGEETKPKTLGFEVGFDTFLGPQAGVMWKNTNILDSGNTLAAELNWSLAGPLGSLTFKNPAFLDSAYAASVRLAVESFDLFEYTRYGTSLNLELARRVNQHFSYTVFGAISVNTVDTDVLTEAEIGPDTYTLASLGMSFMLDHRDSALLPKKGWFLSARIETTLDAMGSGVSFLRTDFRGAWYQPITKKLRFAAGAAIQSLQGTSIEAVPIDSRVFNGGPNSVRAFAERELGYVTPGGTPLGGTAALTVSAEVSYEVMENLELAVFVDTGSLGTGKNSSALSYSSDFRTAVGAGLRYHLPFGPIRIDYGHNLDRRERERGGMLHIVVGFAF